MLVILNNEQIEIKTDLTLSTFLKSNGYGDSRIAVAVNATFVPRTQYQEVILNEHDTIDIIMPMQGG